MGIAGSDGRLYVASQNPEISGLPGSPDLTLSDSTNGVAWQEDTPYYTYEQGRLEGTTGDVTMTADRARQLRDRLGLQPAHQPGRRDDQPGPHHRRPRFHADAVP